MRTGIFYLLAPALILFGCSGGTGTNRAPVSRGASPTPIPDSRPDSGLGAPGSPPLQGPSLDGPSLGAPETGAFRDDELSGAQASVTERTTRRLPTALRSSGYRGRLVQPIEIIETPDNSERAEVRTTSNSRKNLPIQDPHYLMGPPPKGYLELDAPEDDAP